MHLLRTFQERFGFTRNELTAILVLSMVFLAGAVIKLFLRSGPGTTEHQAFSYAALDSQFLALSRSPRDTASDQHRSVARKSATHPVAKSIELNRATSEQLQSLPGIGPALAHRIVTYRNEHGAFVLVDDLAEVKGIGPRTLERIRPFIMIGGDSTRRVP
jgi:comEA protein